MDRPPNFRSEVCDRRADQELEDQMAQGTPGSQQEVERFARRSLHLSLLASCEVAAACSDTRPLNLPRSHPTELELELMYPLQGRMLAGQAR